MSGRPRDRFDDVPEGLGRVGAHRAPTSRTRGIVVVAWAALATGLLVGAGVLGLGAIEGRVTGSTTAVSRSAAPTSAAPAATIDPSSQVVVLNATSTSGLAASAGDVAKEAGWTVQSVQTASETAKTSTVYYSDASQEGAARGLARTLGIGATALSEQFAVSGQDRLTVVLGTDYVAKG